MRKLLTILFICEATFSLAQIQNFKYLGEDYWDYELYIGAAIRNINFEVPNAPNPSAHKGSAWTGDFQLYRSAPSVPGKMRYMLRNKVLGEIFLSFGDNFDEIYRDEGSTFSHFLMGSNSFAWNLLSHNRLQVALGFNLSDLVTGSTLVLQDSLGNDYRETPAPHGWYIGSGPSIFIDFLISPFLLLEVQYDYTFHFNNPVPLTYGIDSPNQKMPHQSFLSVNLMTSFGLYAGVDYSLMLDQNPAQFNHRKIDWLMGFKFML